MVYQSRTGFHQTPPRPTGGWRTRKGVRIAGTTPIIATAAATERP